MKFFSLIRKNYLSILFIMFTLFLLLFANSNISASKSGITLWAKNVVPSLFPFFIAVNLLMYSSVPYYLSKILNKFVTHVFNVPSISSFPFIMGLISGSPIGAKITCKLYDEKILSRSDAEKVICFTNNSSPLFIIGTLGISFYSSTLVGVCILICHVLSAITIGIIVGRFSKPDKNFTSFSSSINEYSINYAKENLSTSSLGKILSASIFDAIKSVLMVGGFVTLFSIIISMLNSTNILPVVSEILANIFGVKKELVSGFLYGILEFTNGLSLISKVPMKNLTLKLVLSSFVLGFGGISVFFQVVGIIADSKLSARKYLRAKILQGLIASTYTFLLFQIPMLNLNL